MAVEIPDDVVMRSFEAARAVLAQSSDTTVVDAMRAAGNVFVEWALEEAAKALEVKTRDISGVVAAEIVHARSIEKE